jgi:hypothetical protein
VPPPNQVVTTVRGSIAITQAAQSGGGERIEIPAGTPPIIINNLPLNPGKSQCHDLPGNFLNLPPGGPDGRNVHQLRQGLSDLGYQPVEIPAGQLLPPLSVVPGRSIYVVGEAHSGIISKNDRSYFDPGKGYDYTKPAPTMGIPPRVHHRNSLDDVRRAESPRAGGRVGYPYKNEPITIWIPPGTKLDW